VKTDTPGGNNIADLRETARRRRAAPALVVLSLAATGAALAQGYPTKPIRFVTTSGPDVVPRLLGQKFTAAWGQQVLVDPQADGGGTVSATVVAKAPPDGHTLLLATGAHTISPSFYKLPYDMARDSGAKAE